MKIDKIIFIGIVFAVAIGLTSPHVSFACWFTGENTYECCTVCCQDADVCQGYLSGDGLFQSGCRFNWYCMVNPVYCSNICLQMEVCPFGIILDDDQTKLDVLREIRDTRFLTTDVGKSLVDLYYHHAGEVTAILRGDEDLLAITANITDEIVDRALEADSHEEMIIDRELVESGLEVTDVIADEAGPELKKTIRMLQRQIKRKVLLGKLGITITE